MAVAPRQDEPVALLGAEIWRDPVWVDRRQQALICASSRLGVEGPSVAQASGAGLIALGLGLFAVGISRARKKRF